MTEGGRIVATGSFSFRCFSLSVKYVWSMFVDVSICSRSQTSGAQVPPSKVFC